MVRDSCHSRTNCSCDNRRLYALPIEKIFNLSLHSLIAGVAQSGRALDKKVNLENQRAQAHVGSNPTPSALCYLNAFCLCFEYAPF